MSQIKQLLVEELQDLLSAENQLVAALPKMAQAAHDPKLRELFEKHLVQTQNKVERLNEAFELLGEDGGAKTCAGMAGLIQEGQQTIEESAEKDEFSADLALVCAAQKVEHYEISGYGTARTLALQLNEREVAQLLSCTLGEEEASDFLLTEASKPILQDALSGEFDARKTSLSPRSHSSKPKVKKAT